jgi:Ran GTPase-activating protein (RanGAP) involved in mRNA processing and transport
MFFAKKGSFTSKSEDNELIQKNSHDDKRRKAVVDAVDYLSLLGLGQLDIDRRDVTGVDFNDAFFEEIKKMDSKRTEEQGSKKNESEKNIKIKVDEKVYKEGYLQKEGRIRKTWKKRWFILNGPALNYYTANNHKYKGSIPLEACQIKIIDRQDGKTCLMLINNGVIEDTKNKKGGDDDDDGAERVLYFDVVEKDKAAMEESRKDWLYALNARIAVLQYSKKMKQQRRLEDIDILEFFLKGKAATELALNKEISIEGLAAIKEPIRGHPNLKILNLSHTRLGDAGVTSLCEALTQNFSINTLNLSGCSITGTGLTSLKGVMDKTSTITSLDLSSNGIDNPAMVIFCAMLGSNKTLKYFNLAENQIGDDAVVPLVDVLLKNTSVQVDSLLLAGNQISDTGCVGIAKLLSSQYRLKMIDLSHNKIGNDGAESISQAMISNKELTTLNLEYNEIGYTGATKLTYMLNNNQTLNSILLGGNRLGEQAMVLIGESDMLFPDLELQTI